MSFSTLPFLFYFLPAFLAVYYIVPARFRNAVLALGSLLFYWLGAGTGALLVLVALILVNFAAGRLIEDAHGDERRAWLILALACDVGSLFYFKYMGWFLENLGRLTNTDFSFFRVALPLGVSFYVFQSIAYVADVYRGDAEAERSLLDYAAFQAMFPQLVMGPILRLLECSPGRLVGLAGRRGIEFGQQIALANPASLVRMNGGKGPAERETQSYGASGRHGPDIDGGHRIIGRFRHDRPHAQGFDRPQRLPRGTGCRKKQHCQKGHSFHLHRVFGCKIAALRPTGTALDVGVIRQKVRI